MSQSTLLQIIGMQVDDSEQHMPVAYLKLVESVVAKLRGCKQEACPQYTDRAAGWNGVEVLHSQLHHSAFVCCI